MNESFIITKCCLAYTIALLLPRLLFNNAKSPLTHFFIFFQDEPVLTSQAYGHPVSQPFPLTPHTCHST